MIYYFNTRNNIDLVEFSNEKTTSSLSYDDGEVVLFNTQELKAQLKQSPNIDYDKLEDEEKIPLIASCGYKDDVQQVEIQSLFDDFNVHPSQLSNDQLTALENYQNNPSCSKWYSYAQSISETKKQELKSIMAEENSRAMSFSVSTDSQVKLQLSKKILMGKDNSFHEDLALSFLLQSDVQLLSMIADEINTENTGYIQSQAIDILKLYQCKKDYKSCAKESRTMSFKCLLDESNCNIDYITYIERKRTMNEVSDLHNMVSALIKILDSGYPYSI